MDKSKKAYIVLVFVLAFCSAITLFLPMGNSSIPQGKMPFPLPIMAVLVFIFMFIVYGGLGLIGLHFSRKVGFSELWDKRFSNRKRFLVPLHLGIILGIVFIVCDIIFANFNSLGKFIHPPFPTSVIASITAGIGEEIIFRLFFISFFTWVLSSFIFKKYYHEHVFLLVSVVSAVLFALAHIPSVMVLYGFSSPLQISPIFYLEMILLNGLVGMFAAYYMKKYGFLLAVGIHFWTDIVWHVVYGLI